ncbi:uncharacterized protein LOC129241630 [Anastrepha obliqua]|uniref:uncharacterized protein LOC129241630 n=1 Tax=Anastrepha obliqua TaxID=95512 RepID=UPI00240A4C29|nr:uncharacterized protein LOC129241630 [Anastrepha obliqua]
MASNDQKCFNILKLSYYCLLYISHTLNQIYHLMVSKCKCNQCYKSNQSRSGPLTNEIQYQTQLLNQTAYRQTLKGIQRKSNGRSRMPSSEYNYHHPSQTSFSCLVRPALSGHNFVQAIGV